MHLTQSRRAKAGTSDSTWDVAAYSIFEDTKGLLAESCEHGGPVFLYGYFVVSNLSSVCSYQPSTEVVVLLQNFFTIYFNYTISPELKPVKFYEMSCDVKREVRV